MHVHLPNLLTFLRLILAPALIIYLIVDKTDSAKFLGMFVFIVIIATDFFDGYLARKFNNVSNFGKVFDPIADKMIISFESVLKIHPTRGLSINFPLSA